MTRFRVFEPVFAMATCFRTPPGSALLQQSRLRPASSLVAPRALSDSHPPPAANSLIWTPGSSFTNFTDRILLHYISFVVFSFHRSIGDSGWKPAPSQTGAERRATPPGPQQKGSSPWKGRPERWLKAPRLYAAVGMPFSGRRPVFWSPSRGRRSALCPRLRWVRPSASKAA